MCDKQLQDVQDYIQYQFEDFSSFKLAVFLNSGEIKVKVGDQNLLENLLSSIGTQNFRLDDQEFNLEKETPGLKEFTTESGSSRVFLAENRENVLIVYCNGNKKDEPKIRELITDFLF
uniref:Roadblock/LC7 domain-containing protein n=1 Tax=Caenorhabditis tropicalis TaxID=1561998 RepID=A0A1I7T4Q1_9PELO